MNNSKMSLKISALQSKIQREKNVLEANSNTSSYIDVNSNAGIYICTYIKDARYVYIGKTNNFFRRWQEHETDLIKGQHCGFFQTFYNQYNCCPSDFKWEILEPLELNEDIISARESYWIRQYNNDKYHILLNTVKYKEK